MNEYSTSIVKEIRKKILYIILFTVVFICITHKERGDL